MGKRVVDDATLSGIADHIRAKTGKADPLILPDGFDSGVDEVYEAGQQSANRAQWHALQKGGARKNYSNAFAQTNYTRDTFLPIYDIRPTGSLSSMFYQSNSDENGTTVTFDMAIDMVEVEQKQGIVFDTSAATGFYMAFAGSPFKRLNTINCSGATDMSYAFYGGYGSRLQRIEHLICGPSTKFHSTSFQTCNYLEYIGFEGTIAQNGLELKINALNKATFEALLATLSTTTSGLSVTLSKTAVNAAFTDAEWTALANTRSNWTINLV